MKSTISKHLNPKIKSTSLFKLLAFLSITWLLLLTISILGMYYPIEVSFLSHIIFPAVIITLKEMETKLGPIKIATLMFGRLLIIMAALDCWSTGIETVILVLLLINILEATIFDILQKSYSNAITGILLIASGAFLQLEWLGTHLIFTNSCVFWIITYTIWNSLVVIRQGKDPYILLHAVILFVPISFACFEGNSASWLMMRELSLYLGIVLLVMNRPWLKRFVANYMSLDQFHRFQNRVMQSKVQIPLLLLNISLLLLFILVEY